MSVGIVGGTGFIGRALGEQLTERGRGLRVFTRRATHASVLRVYPQLEVRLADPQDEAALARHFEGLEAVVNLAGILHERGRQTFQAVHVDIPRKVVNACRAAGVKRLVHVSALGASESAPSAYLRSKALGEKAVLQGAGENLAVVVLRPSVVFGREDGFTNAFAAMARLFPVIALPAAHARLQPIWVEDLARAIAFEAEARDTPVDPVHLCGPHAVSLQEAVEFIASLVAPRTRVLPMPDALAQLQAAVLEHLPGPLLTRDNLRSLSVPNTCGGPFPARYGFAPASLEAIVPAYLTAAHNRGRYARYRAGR
jgi:uncharacterized protein YbjT (DUF2867 family)